MSEPRDPNPEHEPGKKTGDPRQITYRVGWKSGTIHLQEKKEAGPKGGTLSSYAVKPVRTKVYMSPKAETRQIPLTPMERVAALLLRPAPLPSARSWKAVLAVVPVAAFGALCWLTLTLSRLIENM
jgi:hypothetical protein